VCPLPHRRRRVLAGWRNGGSTESGSEVKQCAPSRIGDDGYWRGGATEYRLRVCVALRAQGGGIAWRRGGIDGKPGERFRFGLTPWR
jgi:hypothetical protein